MIQTKHWREMSDAELARWLADTEADDRQKNEYISAAALAVQCGWTRGQERSRRLGHGHDQDDETGTVETQVVHIGLT